MHNWLVGNMHAPTTLHITIPTCAYYQAANYNPCTMCAYYPFNTNPPTEAPIELDWSNGLEKKIYNKSRKEGNPISEF